MSSNSPADAITTRGYQLFTAERGAAPAEIDSAVERSIHAAEQFFGELRTITAAVGLKIVYDPFNRLQSIPHGAEGFGGYHWLERMLLLGDQGLHTSLIHELAHLLDVEAGPTPQEARAVFHQPVWTHRINWEWQQHDQPAAQFLIAAVTNINAARHYQTPEEDLLGKLEKPLDAFPSSFLAELWANLVEETPAIEQSDAGLPPVGVQLPQHYDQHPMYWQLDWLRAHQAEVHALVDARKTLIAARIDKRQLERLHQARRRAMRDNFIFSI